MASPTQWTWLWVNSRSWWWTRRPGVLRFMRSQRVGHDWATELTDWLLGRKVMTNLDSTCILASCKSNIKGPKSISGNSLIRFSPLIKYFLLLNHTDWIQDTYWLISSTFTKGFLSLPAWEYIKYIRYLQIQNFFLFFNKTSWAEIIQLCLHYPFHFSLKFSALGKVSYNYKSISKIAHTQSYSEILKLNGSPKASINRIQENFELKTGKFEFHVH